MVKFGVEVSIVDSATLDLTPHWCSVSTVWARAPKIDLYVIKMLAVRPGGILSVKMSKYYKMNRRHVKVISDASIFTQLS